MTEVPMRIPLSNPDITELEVEAVVNVLRSSRLSLGPKLVEFEERLAEYVSARHAVGLSSGTAGLCLGLQALGIGAGDEVIVPSFTFIAAANAIRYVGANPVFVDIDPHTLNLDPEAVRVAITSHTRAIMVVHTFGCPADLDALKAIAQRHNLFLVEDACEALGAEYQGRRVGPIGTFGVFSFYPNKPITTGEGGVLVTNDGALAAKVRALRNQGRYPEDNWLEHSLLGYNYRLPEMSCALGIAQLSRIESILARRETLARKYCELLAEECPGVVSPLLDLAGGQISWFAFVVRLPLDFAGRLRDVVAQKMAELGIGCRAYFPPIHGMPLYAGCARCELPVTDDVSSRTLALPFFNHLRPEDMVEVCHCLGQTLAGLRNT